MADGEKTGMTLVERFEKFKKEREVKGIKRELSDFNEDEKRAHKLEAEAARAERNLAAKKRLEAATCRINEARNKRKSFNQTRKCSRANNISSLIWPKKTGAKGQKKGRSEMAEILWPSPRKHKQGKAKKKGSIFDGLF